MAGLNRFIVFIAMVILTIVSMWTTYVSLRDSILPEPVVRLPLPLEAGAVWECSVFALLLSVAIGLMLFGLKMAIIDEQKRLNLPGILGLTVVAFISIAFNMDVLYRTADKEFFLRYSASQMTQQYEEYLSDAQQVLTARRDVLRKEVAKQEAELTSEVEGLRAAPQGYGPRAKEEEYKLRIIESENSVELESVEEALAEKEEVDALLAGTFPATIAEVEQLQNELRAKVRDIGAAAGVAMPPPVRLDSPIFAVFTKLFDFENIGMKEIFFLLIAFFLDLGDIIGYSLIPASKRPKCSTATLYPMEPANQAEYIPSWDSIEGPPQRKELTSEERDFFGESRLEDLGGPHRESGNGGRPPRSFRIRHR